MQISLTFKKLQIEWLDERWRKIQHRFTSGSILFIAKETERVIQFLLTHANRLRLDKRKF